MKPIVSALAIMVGLSSGFAMGSEPAAGSEVAPPSKTIVISRAELATSSGIVRVHSQLTDAAEEVCSDLDGRLLSRHVLYRRCVSAALEQAVAEVHDPALSAYHARIAGPAAVAVLSSSGAAGRVARR